MSEIVNKIKFAMSLRTPQDEALSYLDAISSHCDYKKERKVKAGFDFPSFCYAMATGIGKTRLMGASIYYLYKTKGYKHFFILAPFLRLEIRFMTSCARSLIRTIQSISSKDWSQRWAGRRCMTAKIMIPIL